MSFSFFFLSSACRRPPKAPAWVCGWGAAAHDGQRGPSSHRGGGGRLPQGLTAAGRPPAGLPAAATMRGCRCRRPCLIPRSRSRRSCGAAPPPTGREGTGQGHDRATAQNPPGRSPRPGGRAPSPPPGAASPGGAEPPRAPSRGRP